VDISSLSDEEFKVYMAAHDKAMSDKGEAGENAVMEYRNQGKEPTKAKDLFKKRRDATDKASGF